MNVYRAGMLCVAFGTLTAFGAPDASGIYVQVTPREVDLVQLVQTGDGKVTGRMEYLVIDPNGAVKDQTIALEGAVSRRDIMFKPTSVWIGGLQGTGTFSDYDLTIVAGGNTMKFQRSTLARFQSAVGQLQTVAAGDRQRIAVVQANKAAQDARTKAVQTTTNRAAAIENATGQLRTDTAKINSAVANCPDFGQRAADNTERVQKMMRVAPTLSDLNRNQLIVQANQVEVGTNQIEVARSQYAIQLNQIVNDATPIADQLESICGSTRGAPFAQQCGPAKVEAADFRSSLARGRQTFLPYKQVVQQEIQRQASMIQRMGG